MGLCRWRRAARRFVKPMFDEWFNLYCDVTSEEVHYFVGFLESLFYMLTPAQVIFDVKSQVFFTVSACSQSSPKKLKLNFFPQNVIWAHLSWASSILFDLNHVAMLSRSSWMVIWSFPIAKIFRSSAKMNGFEHFSASAKSLMKMQNRSGPSNEPWGFPLLTSRTPKHVLSILTNCFRLLK